MASPDDPTDVLRIRLWNPRRATALLAQLHDADRLLAGWAAQPGCDPVGFEVTFVDGHVVRGCHRFAGGERPCRFSTHVRRLLRDAAAA